MRDMKGADIPKELGATKFSWGGRIMAVADYFEALTANQYYNEPMPPEQVLEILIEKRGAFFDSKTVDVFVNYYHAVYLNDSDLWVSAG